MEQDVERIAHWVVKGGYTRVGIQCPDHLLTSAPALCKALSALCENALVFLLGDTSYQSCCVDEVAAQHYGADAIVHLGESCQSPTSLVPTLFVFERVPLVLGAWDVPPEVQERGVLVYETHFWHHEAAIVEKFRIPYVARPMRETNGPREKQRRYPWYVVCPLWRTLICWKQVKVCGRDVYRGDNVVPLPADPIFVYVGAPNSALERRLLLRWGYVGEIYRDGVRIESDSALARRFGAVQAAKSAEFFGIIVGSVAVEGVTEACSRIEQILEKSGKKSVRLLFGKLSVAKLGNIPEVDCFVLVSCPQHEALFSKEYPTPIVTPFDVEVAFEAREWSTEYKLDLVDLIQDPVEWSNFDAEDALPTDIVSWHAGLLANSARTWGGLDSEPSKPLSLAVSGQHGVASRYEGEMQA